MEGRTAGAAANASLTYERVGLVGDRTGAAISGPRELDGRELVEEWRPSDNGA